MIQTLIQKIKHSMVSSRIFWPLAALLLVVFLGVGKSAESQSIEITREDKIESISEAENTSIRKEDGTLLATNEEAKQVSTAGKNIETDDASLPGLLRSWGTGIVNGVKRYTVKRGDTISGIAEKFDISASALRGANPNLRRSGTIRIGEALQIPVIERVNIEVSGEESVSIEETPTFTETLERKTNGEEVVVNPSLDPKKYFSLPVNGWNWGKAHGENGADLSSACGSPIRASADGKVIEESGNNLWNMGYGNYIVLEHPNGTHTKYARTLRNEVRIGDDVKKGTVIARVGNVNNADGKIGCHIQFEVYGAKNPFIKE